MQHTIKVYGAPLTLTTTKVPSEVMSSWQVAVSYTAGHESFFQIVLHQGTFYVMGSSNGASVQLRQDVRTIFARASHKSTDLDAALVAA